MGFNLKIPLKKRFKLIFSLILFDEIKEIADLWLFKVPYDEPWLKQLVRKSNKDGTLKL